MPWSDIPVGPHLTHEHSASVQDLLMQTLAVSNQHSYRGETYRIPYVTDWEADNDELVAITSPNFPFLFALSDEDNDL